MLLLAPVLLSLLVPVPQKGDWPQFRGPARDGSTVDAQWSSHGRDAPLWKASVGQGYASPSIVSGRLLTTGHFAESNEDRIVCLDAETGAEIWRFTFAADDAPMFHEGGTLTTPSIRDGRVYCLDRDGVLRVLTLEGGELLWSKDYATELRLERPFHGFSASPLLVGERVVLQLGGALAVLDSTDGAVVWSTEDRGDCSYSDPVIVDLAGRRTVAAVLNMDFVVHDFETGELMHEYSWELKGNAVHCATPLVFGDSVFLSTAYGKGCALLKLGEGLQPEQLWAHRKMRNKVTSCVRHGEHLYGFDESMLRCADLEGGVTWRVRGLGLGSLTLADDRLLVLSSDGELIVAEASPVEFRELSRRKVLDSGVYWTSPVLVGGLIYVRNSHGDLVCLDHRSAFDPVVASGPDVVPLVAPAAADLFAGHAGAVGSDELPDARALRITGTWSVVLRGLEPSPMTWILAAPDRWSLSLDAGGLAYGHAGEYTWAIEPQGVRLVEGEERRELVALFPLRDLVAPPCPPEATTVDQPMPFAEVRCWKVSSPVAGEAGALRQHWFDVETGRLVGTEGAGRSTLVFDGRFELGGVSLPARVTRFCVDDGQEHVLEVTGAEWVELAPDLFALPESVQRLLRSPEEIAAGNVELRARFMAMLGTYRDEEEGMDCEVLVEQGDLWIAPKDGSRPWRVDVAGERNGVFPLVGPPFRVTFDPVENGRAPSFTLIFGPGPEAERVQLPRVDR